MGKYRPIIVTAECGTLTRAGKILGYTQPSLGYIINKTPSGLKKTLAGLKSIYVFQKAEYLTPENLFDWQDAGYKVGVWTVNDAAAIKQWLGLGVDYLTSDYPKLVNEALQ